MDLEKLQKVQERMRAVLNEEKPLVSFEDLAKATGLWEVVDAGSTDEPCAIRVGACMFEEEDESSMTLDDCDEAALQQEENVELWQIQDALEGDAEKDGAENPVKLTPAQELRVKKAVLNIKADFLIQLRHGLWQDLVARIEQRMSTVAAEIPGFRYVEWEELDHYVEVDGERYRMDHWYEHHLMQAGKGGKTVDELASTVAN